MTHIPQSLENVITIINTEHKIWNKEKSEEVVGMTSSKLIMGNRTNCNSRDDWTDSRN